MCKVEGGMLGVVWVIGFDGMLYYYFGGYGGGIFISFDSSVFGIY